MSDLIDRIELMRQIAEFGREIPKDQVMEVIARMEDVEVEDRPKGEWVYHRNELSCVRWNKWECTVCHRRQENTYNFCPNCGADMRGEDE